MSLPCSQFGSTLEECSAGNISAVDSISVLSDCQLNVGEDVLDFYDMSVDNYALGIVMLIVMAVVMRAGALGSLLYRARRSNK